jgi:hypothetical protein
MEWLGWLEVGRAGRSELQLDHYTRYALLASTLFEKPHDIFGKVDQYSS